MPKNPDNDKEYDSPPVELSGHGRLDSDNLSVLYASEDIDTCIHECRFTVEDEIYCATLQPKKELKLLNLTKLLDENCTEFESLDLAIHFLFMAGLHSYDLARFIAETAYKKGYDGLLFPSFFSVLRTGAEPLRTAYGISLRRFPSTKEIEESLSIPNLALFGHPVADGKVAVRCINKLIVRRVDYEYHFGPAEFS